MDDATYRRLDKQLRRHRNQVWVGRINGPMVMFLGFLCFVMTIDYATPLGWRVASAALGLISVMTGVWAFRLQFKPMPPELAAFEEYRRKNRDKIPLRQL
jgi:hypothetical protein